MVSCLKAAGCKGSLANFYKLNVPIYLKLIFSYFSIDNSSTVKILAFLRQKQQEIPFSKFGSENLTHVGYKKWNTGILYPQ
jgi:hypothetical protein